MGDSTGLEDVRIIGDGVLSKKEKPRIGVTVDVDETQEVPVVKRKESGLPKKDISEVKSTI